MKSKRLTTEILKTDILIIGGGAAGCYAALSVADLSDAKVLVVDKANIRRSGCLAGGINAINGYINAGESPDKYVDYVKKDSQGIVREDLLITMSRLFHQVTERVEELGLTIHKDDQGNYIPRGRRGIRINGENIKPILARGVRRLENVEVLQKVNIIDYIVKDGRIIGAYGLGINKRTFYVIYSKAVICTTGGAAGLYRPKNWSFSRHKIWYCPFNTGAGYAMGIRAGAEMTTFEMRFIALRCKDTISPTGTIARGLKVRQINRKGREYVKEYGENSTPNRLYSTVEENKRGEGPCYLETKGISKEQEQDLFKAYLNMSIAQPLKWVDSGKGPAEENVEIEGTEPYIVGGHAASGYWIDTHRRTTIDGLYAAGDVAGGSPKKYVTGCFAEGKIAAESALKYIEGRDIEQVDKKQMSNRLKLIKRYFNNVASPFTIEEAEQRMQAIMDKYVGGISQDYVVEVKKLKTAKWELKKLLCESGRLKAKNMHDLLHIHEVVDRLYVCLALIHHIESRKESRWLCYLKNADYPERDDANWLKYVNSVYKNRKFTTIYRELVGREHIYEHPNQ